MAIGTGEYPPTLFDLPQPEQTTPRRTHIRGRVTFGRRSNLFRFLRDRLARVMGSTRRLVTLEAIERDRSVFGGAAVIARTKVPVFFVEDIYSRDGSVDAVLASFPRLSEADVFAALSYARVYPAAVERDRRRYLSLAPPETTR
jgi:uncharacterized protein (DUF433 family)